MNELQKILKDKNLNISTNSKGTDKGDYKSYIDLYYYKTFLPLKEKKITLLEIGVRHGASIILWNEFFKNIEIYGIDNLSDTMLNDNPFEYSNLKKNNIRFFNMNAYEKKNIKKINSTFDIIIDDGPHTLSSQLFASKHYTPLLNINGKLIIEDIQKFGKFSIFFFLFHLNLKYKLDIFDFRKHKQGSDNLLIVIENSNKYLNNLLSRCNYLILSFFFILFEFLIVLKRKIFINK